jgi:hypothetical protein
MHPIHFATIPYATALMALASGADTYLALARAVLAVRIMGMMLAFTAGGARTGRHKDRGRTGRTGADRSATGRTGAKTGKGHEGPGGTPRRPASGPKRVSLETLRPSHGARLTLARNASDPCPERNQRTRARARTGGVAATEGRGWPQQWEKSEPERVRAATEAAQRARAFSRNWPRAGRNAVQVAENRLQIFAKLENAARSDRLESRSGAGTRQRCRVARRVTRLWDALERLRRARIVGFLPL